MCEDLDSFPGLPTDFHSVPEHLLKYLCFLPLMVFKNFYLEHKEYYGTDFSICFVFQQGDLYKHKW